MNRKRLMKLYDKVSSKHLGCRYSWLIDDFMGDREFKALMETQPDKDGIYDFDSPEEAAIFLSGWQARRGFYNEDFEKLKYGEQFENVDIFKCIFRGQKACHADIKPSAWRDSTWTRLKLTKEQGKSWEAAFCLLMKSMTVTLCAM